MRHLTDNPTPPPEDDDQQAEIIRLAPVILPVRQLLGFYDDLLDKDKAPPPREQLDEAIVELKALPALPGRLGRDIDLVVNGAGEGASRDELVESIEWLRQIAAMEIPAPIEQRVQTQRKRRKTQLAQDSLPGIG